MILFLSDKSGIYVLRETSRKKISADLYNVYTDWALTVLKDVFSIHVIVYKQKNQEWQLWADDIEEAEQENKKWPDYKKTLIHEIMTSKKFVLTI